MRKAIALALVAAFALNGCIIFAPGHKGTPHQHAVSQGIDGGDSGY